MEASKPETKEKTCSEQDWFIIDEALHRVARSLRKIAREEQLKNLKVADREPAVDYALTEADLEAQKIASEREIVMAALGRHITELRQQLPQ